jgi:hypothetical protein
MQSIYGIKAISSFDSINYVKVTGAIKEGWSGDIEFLISDTAQFRKYSKLDFGKFSPSLLQPYKYCILKEIP